MIISQIIGGLGNQMFQYAFGRSLSLKHSIPLKLDTTGFQKYKLHDYGLSQFQIDEHYASPHEIRKYCGFWRFPFLRPKTFIMEKNVSLHPEIIQQSPPLYLEGYWQSEK